MKGLQRVPTPGCLAGGTRGTQPVLHGSTERCIGAADRRRRHGSTLGSASCVAQARTRQCWLSAGGHLTLPWASARTCSALLPACCSQGGSRRRRCSTTRGRGSRVVATTGSDGADPLFAAACRVRQPRCSRVDFCCQGAFSRLANSPPFATNRTLSLHSPQRPLTALVPSFSFNCHVRGQAAMQTNHERRTQVRREGSARSASGCAFLSQADSHGEAALKSYKREQRETLTALMPSVSFTRHLASSQAQATLRQREGQVDWWGAGLNAGRPGGRRRVREGAGRRYRAAVR